jgi:hypothetical protein
MLFFFTMRGPQCHVAADRQCVHSEYLKEALILSNTEFGTQNASCREILWKWYNRLQAH